MPSKKGAQFLVLEASAGSGKTYALALRYVALLLEGAKIHEILALTFTNKAVDEMRQRIGDFLRILALEPRDANQASKRQGLLDSLEGEYGWSAEDVMRRAPRLLEQYWREYPKILTLDAFFGAIVREFCWYVGVSFGFEMGESGEEELRESFLSALGEREREDLIAFCVRHDKALSWVLMCLEKLDMQMPECLEPLGLEEGSQEDLLEEVMCRANAIASSVRAHSGASSSALKAVDFSSLSELLDKSKTWIGKGVEYRDFKKLGLDEGAFERLRQSLIAYYAHEEKALSRFFQTMSKRFEQSKNLLLKRQKILSFADVSKKTYELLAKGRISSDFFYFRLDARISHLLLDEFQDTSILQYQILLPLIQEILAGEGRIGDRSLFAVGDKKQSIYGFRGGCGELLEYLKGLSSEIVSESLRYNYRSASEIVAFVNQTFAPKISGYLPQEVPQDRPQGGYVKIVDPVEKEERFEAVRGEIEALLSSGVPLGEIAVLCFTNKEIAGLQDFLSPYFSPIVTEESLALECKKEAQILATALRCAQGGSALDRERLAKLLGGKLGEKVETPEFEGDVGGFILKAMRSYGLNSKIAKEVLHCACDSQNPQEFFQKLASQKQSAEGKEGLRLLTIHKSKGLEFEHLILLDNSEDRGQEDPFFIEHEGLKGRLRFRNTRRRNLDGDYARVPEREDAKKRMEALNVLYVAFTRACQSLIIIPTPKGCFEPLELKTQCLGKLDPKPAHIPPKSPSISKPVVQKSFGPQEGYIQKEKLPFVPNNPAAIFYGEMLHKGLELYLGHKVEQESLIGFLQNSYGARVQEGEFENLLEFFARVKELLREKFAWTDIKTEVSFMQAHKLYRIDCLLFCQDSYNDKIIVLDYKSGQSKKEHHDQVKLYTDFIKSQYPKSEVEGVLLYLDGLRLERVA